jgi:hypothetical protein
MLCNYRLRIGLVFWGGGLDWDHWRLDEQTRQEGRGRLTGDCKNEQHT